MKRTIALLLCALLPAGLLAACGGESRAQPITTADYGTAAPSDISYDVPEGWIPFARLDADNIAEVQGFFYLRGGMDESVPVSNLDIVTVNTMEVFITSVTVNGLHSVPVRVVERSGLRVLYAEPADGADDPNLIDLTSAGNLATVPAVDTTRPGATTTRRPVTTTKPLQTVPVIAPTKAPEITKDPTIDQMEEIMKNPNMSAEERAAAIKLLSYKVDKNGIFYVEHEPWQKQFGFNQIYDLASPLIQLVYATIRIKFTYGYVYKLYPKDHEKKGQVMYGLDGKPLYETDAQGKPIQKDWMLQWWKGRYGLVMLGAEFGVYTKPHTQAAEHYNAAVSEEELVMAMDVWQHNFLTGKTMYLFSRGPEKTWWLTGFVPGSFYEYNKKSEIITVVDIGFPDAEMQGLAAAAMERAGFRKGTPNNGNPETYMTYGTNIKFSWQYIDQDAN